MRDSEYFLICLKGHLPFSFWTAFFNAVILWNFISSLVEESMVLVLCIGLTYPFFTTDSPLRKTRALRGNILYLLVGSLSWVISSTRSSTFVNSLVCYTSEFFFSALSVKFLFLFFISSCFNLWLICNVLFVSGFRIVSWVFL